MIELHVSFTQTYHVFKASQHCSSNYAQKESHDVEDGSGPQEVIEVHHVLAALHVCVLVVASNHLYSARPVGGTERETAYSQATKVIVTLFLSMYEPQQQALSICSQDTVKDIKLV